MVGKSVHEREGVRLRGHGMEHGRRPASASVSDASSEAWARDAHMYIRRSGEVDVKGSRREIKERCALEHAWMLRVCHCVGEAAGTLSGENISTDVSVCEFVFWMRARMVSCAGSRTVRELPQRRWGTR